MPVRYSVRSNPFPDGSDRHYGRVEPIRSVGLDEVLDRLTGPGSALTRADARAVLTALPEVVARFLAEGATVTLPAVNFTIRMQGVFEDYADRFDPARHRLVPKASPGRDLKRRLRTGLSVEHVVPSRPRPAPQSYLDHSTGERDAALTPGGIGELRGTRLGFDPADPEAGVFLIGPDRAATRVGVVALVRPKRVLFQVPDGLEAGAYRLEVRARFGEALRTGFLQDALTVA